MAYRIDYSSGSLQRKTVHRKPLVPTIKTILFILALIVGAVTVKVVGFTWVRDVLLPGNPAVTATALQNMTDNLRSGDSLLDAITTFCQEIVAHAQ